jgi:hypothetical protein
MRFRKSEAVLVAPAMLLVAMVGEAAAQTISHDVNGRAYTYDFKRQAQASLPSEGQARPTPTKGSPKPRPSGTELPRGPRNIPWDEPGKILGVPGVDDNPATNLSIARSNAAKKPASARQVRVQAPSGRDHVSERREAAPEGGALLNAKAPDDALSRNPRGVTPKTNQTQGPSEVIPDSPPAIERSPAPQLDEAEVRAKIIAEAAAKALSEEQRRLALERSRDRRSRHLEPASSSAPSLTEQHPASTGSTGAAKATDTELSLDPSPQSNPNREGGVCRTLFFGLLPGC